MRRYEGLIFKTAQMHAHAIEEDQEDVRQILRIKVWRGLLAYDQSRSGMSRDRWIFMVLTNQVKDLKKRKRRGELHIEDIARTPSSDYGSARNTVGARDAFDERYLSTDHEQVYGDVEDDDFVMPSTLTQLERRIVTLLYRDYKQTEAARQLGLETREVERAVRSIREKLADWNPGGEVVTIEPARERERQAA